MLEYDVPAAAVASDDGTLTYHLAATPQGMVIPQVTTSTVRWPKGYTVSDLPEGWTVVKGNVARWEDPGLVTQPSFTITGSARGSASP